MRRQLSSVLLIAALCASASTVRAADYAACQLSTGVTQCPGDVKFRSGKFLALANIPTLDVAHLPSGIPAVKIGLGTVNDTVLDYLSDVTGPIQLQLNTISGTVAGAVLVSGTQTVAGVKTFTSQLIASLRIETPTIGASAGAQHAFPVGTADLVASDDNRLPPTPTGANKILYDTGTGIGETAACSSSSTVLVGGSPPACAAVPAGAIPNTGVSAGSYPTAGQISTFTVGADGRLSAAGSSTDGSALASLNASNLSTGTVADARLSANVALLNTAQAFTARKTFPVAGANAALIPAILGGGAGTNGHVVPNVADDTFALLAATQAFTGKTINGALNTLLNIGNGSLVNSAIGLTQPAAGITITGSPVALGGSGVFALANDLAAVEGLTGTGVASRTGVDTWALIPFGTSTQVLHGNSVFSAVDLTADVANILPITNGGTGAATFNAREVLAGPTSGGAAVPTRRVLSGSDVNYTSSTPPFSAGTTVKDALDTLISSAPSQVAVSFSVVPVSGDVGKIYRINSSGLAVLAQGDNLTDITAVRGVYQGNTGYVSVGLGARVQVLLEAGLVGPFTPAPAMPIFVSTTVAGRGTTQDPIDLGTVGSYSLLVGWIEDASSYGSTGLVTVQLLIQLPTGPLGTGASPPSSPPYYVDPNVVTCPSGSAAGNLVAVSGINTVALADNSLSLPAVREIYDKPTTTTCRLYAIPLVRSCGASSAGTVYYLSTGGQRTATVPTTSGFVLQRVGISLGGGNCLPDIDVHGWEVLP